MGRPMIDDELAFSLICAAFSFGALLVILL
jgi:hypothetical protein